MIKSLFITAYKREKIFFSSLKKLKLCQNYNEFKKLVIFQDINKNTLNKIKKFDSKIEVINTQYSLDTAIYDKICCNLYQGFKRCFEYYKSEYVICLEDDILPAYDFLKFHNDIILRYRSNKKFFSVNSFSKEYSINFKKDSITNNNFIYSKFIFGIGKGWSISKEKWPILKKMINEILILKSNVPYDAYFEPEIKSKYFVIMPFRSRCIEQPSNGVHTKLEDKDSKFWINWKKSFLNKNKYKIKNYIFTHNMKYTWRKDCLNYTLFNIIKIRLRYFLRKIVKDALGFEKYFLYRRIFKKLFF